VKCIFCGDKTRVRNSRTIEKPGNGNKGLWRAISACGMENIVWRVRKCKGGFCQKRFDTIELDSREMIKLIKQDATLRGRHEF
jgi:transcriptional regulator NrdR family protein